MDKFCRAFFLFRTERSTNLIRNVDDILRERGIITTPKEDDYVWMTREEAIAYMRAWKDFFIPKYNLDFSYRIKTRLTSGSEYVYATGMINDLIERVRESNYDPITTVAMYYYEMEEVLATSDDSHFITHRIAGYLENASYSVLSYLQKKEKEMNQK